MIWEIGLEPTLVKRHKVKDSKAALCRFPRRELYETLWAVQGLRESWLELGACLGMKNIGKLCGRTASTVLMGRLMNEQGC